MKLLALLLLLLPAAVQAQEGAAFLKIGAGARAAAMGGAYTAVADDANAVAWNPAGLAGIARRELTATHMELRAGTRHDFLGYAQPTRYGVFAAAASYLSHAAISGRNASGQPDGSFDAWDGAFSAAYGARIGFFPALRLGTAVKLIQSRLADAGASSVAVDFGARYQSNEELGKGAVIAGLSVQNIGRGMRFLEEASPLPLTVAAGLGYRLPVGVTLAVDYKHRPRGGSSELSAGTEYAIFPAVALRAGYDSKFAGDAALSGQAPFGGFAAGFGVKIGGFVVDYALTPFGELGSAQRFSIGGRF